MTDAMFEAMFETMHEGDTYPRVEVIAGRRWRQDRTADQKARIVAESFQPGANILEVARRKGCNRKLPGVWRKQARIAVKLVVPAALFTTVQIEDGAAESEVLDRIPAVLRVIRTIRPNYVCRSCDEDIVPAPAPARLIEDGIVSSSSGCGDP